MAYCMYLRKSRADKDYENSSTEAILNRHEKALLELAQNNNYKIPTTIKFHKYLEKLFLVKL